MSGDNPVVSCIAKAERHVATARERWSAASLVRCEECIEELRKAAAAIETAQTEAGSGTVAPGAKRRLQRLRGDLEQLAHRVDASLAFCRGLALRADEQQSAPVTIEG